jgi:glycerol-3-phosphate dehydrogenase
VPRIRPSRGTHVTLPSELLPVVSGAIVPAAKGRSIFVLPWLGRTLIGTTDNDYEGSLDHVPAGADDIEYLLAATNAFFASSIEVSDLTGAYAGVRPLIATGDPKKSVDISRKAELYETSSGLVTITGGKLTTWRRMAKLAVDRIVEREGREALCRTHEIPLGMATDPSSLPGAEGLDQRQRHSLAHRYGHAAVEVLAIAAGDGALSSRVSPDLPDLVAEGAFAVRREQARSLADVLLRRTRLGLLDARRLAAPGAEGAEAMAHAIAAELGWTERERVAQLDEWRRVAAVEGLVPGAPVLEVEVADEQAAAVRS